MFGFWGSQSKDGASGSDPSFEGNPFASILPLTYNPVFDDNSSRLSSWFSSSGLSPDTDTENSCSLDIDRITDRILAMGMCWKNRTEKLSRRNNINEAAAFLRKW
jgi:hypothetical protein